MYFILKYIDYQDYKKKPARHPSSSLQFKKPKADEIKSSSSTKGFKSRSRSMSGSKPSIAGSALESNTTSTTSFVNKEVLINPDCYLGSILDYICEVVGLPRNIYFTMCSVTSELMTVGDAPLGSPGLDFFVPKETYYIILKDFDNLGNEISFPLLRKNTEIYAYFMSKLRNELVEHPTKQSIASSTSSRMKSKDVKVKSRVKSANPQKDGKDKAINLPYTKQRNSIASPSTKKRTSTVLPPITQRN